MKVEISDEGIIIHSTDTLTTWDLKLVEFLEDKDFTGALLILLLQQVALQGQRQEDAIKQASNFDVEEMFRNSPESLLKQVHSLLERKDVS